MTAVMSYHYPHPNSRPNSDGSNLMASNFSLPSQLPAAQPQLSSQIPPSPTQSHDSSVAGKGSKMKRSSSSANVRGEATSEAAAAEKRRNKLGYHRTSVACGHCRKRKIRCIPAQGDPQSRCSNCIRLKKECTFYPVDQNPPTESRQRRESNVHGEAARASMSSSPSATTVHSLGLHGGPSFPNMSSVHEIGGSQSKAQRGESFSPEIRGSRYPRPQEVSQGAWLPSGSPSVSKAPSDGSSSYWRESPVTPAFSPFPTNMHLPHQTWPHNAPEHSPREELGWSIPQRSMSYGHLEGLPQPGSYSQYPPPPSLLGSREDYTPRGTPIHEPYMPAMTPSSGSGSGPSIGSAEPSSHSSTTPHLPQFSVSQGWGAPYTYTKPPAPAEGYGQWYAPEPHLPSQAAPGTGDGMASPYVTQGEGYGSMYYGQPGQEGR